MYKFNQLLLNLWVYIIWGKYFYGLVFSHKLRSLIDSNFLKPDDRLTIFRLACSCLAIGFKMSEKPDEEK